MLSRLKQAAGGASAKPPAYPMNDMATTSRPSDAYSPATSPPRSPTLPPQPRTMRAAEEARPSGPAKTLAHRVGLYIGPISRKFTLVIPIGMIVMIAYVHGTSQNAFWKQFNQNKGGPGTMTWAPFWVTVPYSIVYGAWWYVVWGNYRLRQHQKPPFMSRKLHIILETGFFTLTVLCLVILSLLSRNDSELLVVGFNYAASLTGLLSTQLFFVFGSLVGAVYEHWVEKNFAASRSRVF